MNVLGHKHSYPGIHVAQGFQIGHDYFKLLQNCYNGIHVIGEKNINSQATEGQLMLFSCPSGY